MKGAKATRKQTLEKRVESLEILVNRIVLVLAMALIVGVFYLAAVSVSPKGPIDPTPALLAHGWQKVCLNWTDDHIAMSGRIYSLATNVTLYSDSINVAYGKQRVTNCSTEEFCEPTSFDYRTGKFRHDICVVGETCMVQNCTVSHLVMEDA